MHFLSFVFDHILYMLRIAKLFIIRRQTYMQCLVCIMYSHRVAAIMVKMKLVYGYIVHSYRLAAIKVKMELVYGYFIVHLQKNLLINQ